MSTAPDLEEELRRTNPKGRLWERCAQLRIESPRVRHRAIDDRHQAELTLEIDEWELTSGVHSGWSRKMVEHLAARALLEELERVIAERAAPASSAAPAAIAADVNEDVWEVDDENAERLQELNPKGQVFEWCQRRKIARPRFEMKQARGAFYVRASLTTLHLTSPWFSASQRKIAEQAAADALLPLLPDEVSEDNVRLDPRAELNELRQRNVIADYGFDVVAEAGTPERCFAVVGTMTIAPGRTETTEPIGASSKKEAILLAARELVSRLDDDERAR